MRAPTSGPLAIEDFTELLSDLLHRCIVKLWVDDFNARIIFRSTLRRNDPPLARCSIALSKHTQQTLAHKQKHQHEAKSHAVRAFIIAESLEEIEQCAIIHECSTLHAECGNFRTPEREEIFRSPPRIPCFCGNFNATQSCGARF